MTEYIFPDFNNNIVNISSTFAKYIGVDNKKYATIPELEAELKKNYKNVVFIILDGFGYNVLKQHCSPKGILARNVIKNLTSTFPATTTNATTSLISMSYPCEHNWLGWSLYFKEPNKCIDIYLNTDSFTQKTVEGFSTINYLPYTEYFNRERKSNIAVHTVFPLYVHTKNETNNHPYNLKHEMFDNLQKLLKTNEKKFIYTYCGFPDSTMHEFGVTSKETVTVINELEEGISVLTKNKDTLIVITADHGHIDIKGYCELYSNEKINSLLTRPACLDSRAVSFSIKETKEDEFIQLFNFSYGKYFNLFKAKDLIEKGVFGDCPSETTYEKLGDYIAVGNEKNYIMLLSPDSSRFLGHHTSLTKSEMIVPLIMIRSK